MEEGVGVGEEGWWPFSFEVKSSSSDGARVGVGLAIVVGCPVLPSWFSPAWFCVAKSSLERSNGVDCEPKRLIQRSSREDERDKKDKQKE